MHIHFVLVSDTASKEGSLDKSGPLLKELLTEKFIVVEQTIVADEIYEIRKVIEAWSHLNLVLVTGGTGFSQRDVTPEV